MSLLDLKRVSQFALDHELICSAIYQVPDFLAILSTFCGDTSVTVTTFPFLSDFSKSVTDTPFRASLTLKFAGISDDKPAEAKGVC